MCLPGKCGAGRAKRRRKKHRGALAAAYADPDKGHIRIGGVDLRDMRRTP